MAKQHKPKVKTVKIAGVTMQKKLPAALHRTSEDKLASKKRSKYTKLHKAAIKKSAKLSQKRASKKPGAHKTEYIRNKKSELMREGHSFESAAKLAAQAWKEFQAREHSHSMVSTSGKLKAVEKETKKAEAPKEAVVVQKEKKPTRFQGQKKKFEERLKAKIEGQESKLKDWEGRYEKSAKKAAERKIAHFKAAKRPHSEKQIASFEKKVTKAIPKVVATKIKNRKAFYKTCIDKFKEHHAPQSKSAKTRAAKKAAAGAPVEAPKVEAPKEAKKGKETKTVKEAKKGKETKTVKEGKAGKVTPNATAEKPKRTYNTKAKKEAAAKLAAEEAAKKEADAKAAKLAERNRKSAETRAKHKAEKLAAEKAASAPAKKRTYTRKNQAASAPAKKRTYTRKNQAAPGFNAMANNR